MRRTRFLAILVVLPSVLEAAGTVTGISASPSPATAGSEVAVTVTATGPCQVYVDFGDKTKSAHLLAFPGTVKHAYAAAGKFVLRTFSYTSGNEAPGLSRCGGFADMELVVNPKGGMVRAPNRNLGARGRAADSKLLTTSQAPTPTPTRPAK